jgi:ABC-type dipeptide/oligopeptide/nickel transport system permease subunit
MGGQRNNSGWGATLSGKRRQVFSPPYLVVFPGAAIVITVFVSIYLLGGGLCDALDPRLRR